MADSQIEVVPQPRVDTLVTDASTGMQRRRTEYSGTVWFGGRPGRAGQETAAGSAVASIESPFFLPDSLPYRPDPLEDAQVACNVAIQGAGEGSGHIIGYRAGLIPDPRNGAVCWIQLQISARARLPLAVGYRVVALVALNGILPLERGDGG